LEIAEVLVRSGALDVIVIDSVAALVPRAEIEGEMGDAHVGLQARLMSQALRKLTGAIGRSNTAVVFTNQIREKIGVMFGNPETTSGGRALKFYASLRLDIRRIASIKEGQEQVGSRTRVKVVKNKCAPPFRQAEFDIMFNQGVSREGLLVDMGEDIGVVNRAGAWYSYGDDLRLGQGRENAKVFLKESPDIAEEIEAQKRPRRRVSPPRLPRTGSERRTRRPSRPDVERPQPPRLLATRHCPSIFKAPSRLGRCPAGWRFRMSVTGRRRRLDRAAYRR
jgi:recombination protein RecA